MPVTPFHFGPGALLHAVAPRHVSFLSFCAANVLIDLESLYNLVHGLHPVHAFLHTYAGATLVVLALLLLFLGARWVVLRLGVPNVLGWRALTTMQVGVGAALGAYSHVLLDSVMHRDIAPLLPFSSANALLATVPLGWLHLACLAAGLLGVLIIAVRWFVMGGSDRR
jgi:membrane-bound metal-dependent hydrolase YbcI (DUF457 family)